MFYRKLTMHCSKTSASLCRLDISGRRKASFITLAAETERAAPILRESTYAIGAALFFKIDLS